MSKRKVAFVEEPEVLIVPADQPADEEEEPLKKLKKNTLDSDEEESGSEPDKYDVMDPEEFEGEEAGTSRMDDDVKITPFNMNEELEEGYVTKDGAFVYDKKKKEELTDNWLENIDWVKVESGKPQPGTNGEAEADEEAGPPAEIDVIKCYEEIVTLLQPGETITRALQRLGRTSKKVKGKRAAEPVSETQEAAIAADKQQLLRLSSLADQILQTGDMNVYEKTFEQLSYLITETKKKAASSGGGDMFADDFDPAAAATSTASTAESQATASKTTWEFKWKNEEGVEIFGPHSNDQMVKWSNDGYFDSGVWVRQIGKDGEFYSSKRIDFELYE